MYICTVCVCRHAFQQIALMEGKSVCILLDEHCTHLPLYSQNKSIRICWNAENYFYSCLLVCIGMLRSISILVSIGTLRTSYIYCYLFVSIGMLRTLSILTYLFVSIGMLRSISIYLHLLERWDLFLLSICIYWNAGIYFYYLLVSIEMLRSISILIYWYLLKC